MKGALHIFFSFLTLILGRAQMRALYPSNFAKLTLSFRALTNARRLSASVIVCASLKASFLVVVLFQFIKIVENLSALKMPTEIRQILGLPDLLS